MGGTDSGWAVWFTGLPGCGKSTLADGALEHLRAAGLDPVLLRMDERRKAYFPEPEYTAEERERAYALFADEAAALAGEGRGVLLDGTANELRFRRRARERIPCFAEVFVDCDVDTARKREAARPEGRVMAGLYAKALERRRTGKRFEGLGEVVGVDVPFEADPHAELVLENTELTRDEALRRVTIFLDRWLARRADCGCDA